MYYSFEKIFKSSYKNRINKKTEKMLKSDKSEPKKILVAKEKRLDQITKKARIIKY